MRNVYIGLGSNIGNREKEISSAIKLIESVLAETKSIKSLTVSNIYETTAWKMPKDTPAFLNCVICVETNIELEHLLKELLNIEVMQGRVRNESETYSNRTIDCDILVSGDEVVASKILQVPHPKICSRRFVLQPLCDLEPTLHIPGTGKSVFELLNLCSEEPRVTKWDHTLT